MDIALPELEHINRQLASLERPKKPKMLVVDDEPDNLDLLYRTFRRDFNVLRAESGVMALEVLAAEGEVAVIISDQRMPEMKGTEFLSKTVPQFPDTMRIILTGFTDVEDLVDAINSGQVYKYITKPWDPNELKAVVQRAVETYDVQKHRTEELRRAQSQTILLGTLVKVTQEATGLEQALEAIAKTFGETYEADGCTLQLVEAGKPGTLQGNYGTALPSLGDDPVVQEAIATQKPQVKVNESAEEGVLAHLVLPVLFQSASIAVLSLRWGKPFSLQEDELLRLYLAAQQIALALTCVRFGRDWRVAA
jgi:CheY-like chemotaxis protein